MKVPIRNLRPIFSRFEGAKIQKTTRKSSSLLCFSLSPYNDFQLVAVLCPNLIHFRYCPVSSAEREGFEPPVQLPVHRISSAARSTTPASLLEDRSPKPSFWDCKYRHIFYIRAFSGGKNCVRAKKKLRTGAFARPGLLPVPE